MDTLSDLFDQFKRRFSNPLIFSFLTSWVVFNWEVLIALFWNNSTIPGVPEDLIRYIGGTLTFWKSLIYPLLGAIAYTALIKNLISGLNTWATKWGGNWVLSISKDAKIPISKYIKIRDAYEQRSKELEEVITKEMSTQAQLLDLQSELQRAKKDLVEKNTELLNSRDQISKLTNPSILKGRWKRETRPESSVVVENIEVTNTSVVFVHDGVMSFQRYQINDFIYSQLDNRMQFTLVKLNDSKIEGYAANVLELKFNDWVGWEYSNDTRYEVRYEKVR